MTSPNRPVVCCQQCGGTVEPVVGRDYMQCRYCHTLAFPQHNPLATDRVTPLGEEFDIGCPCCSRPLQKGRIEERNALYCIQCFGMLLKNESFGTIVRERRARRAGNEVEDARPINMAEYDRRIHCPDCQTLMEVHPYYGPGNVVIDSCHKCHCIWLDHGELARIERAAGGRAPEPAPLYVNREGDLTTVAQPVRGPQSVYDAASPLGSLADLLFGLR